MSYNLHEAFCFDSWQSQLLFWDDFEGDSLKDLWGSTGSAGGSTVVVDAQDGGIVRLTTDVDQNDDWLLYWTDVRSLLVSKKVTMETRIKLSSVASIQVLIELRFDNSNEMFFRFNAVVDTNWDLHTESGGSATDRDSGITPDTDYHVFRIECFPAGEVHFYIDGAECANSPITTNIPTQYLQPYIKVQTQANPGAKFIDIDYVYIRQER